MFLSKSKKLHWTYHARAKMAFYKLSEQRVRRVLNSPKRVEEGVAPKTTAAMQPASLKFKTNSDAVPSPFGKFTVNYARRGRGTPSRLGKREEHWNQEIWVMFQETKQAANRKSQIVTKIISAWRYPGKTKPRDEIVKDKIREAYNGYMKSTERGVSW